MLTIMKEDLYPHKDWLFVFGWAMYKLRTGVFSFLRFDPKCMHDETVVDPELAMLQNACHVMVHETGHMFGMTHCTYYECTMNGFNGYNE
jgi:archaemetzincin